PGFRPNPLAEPTTTDTVEAGAVYRRKDLRLAGTLFHSSMHDVLAAQAVAGSVARDGFTTYAVRNIGDLRTRGLEVEAAYNFDPRRSLQATWTVEKPTFADGGARLPGQPSTMLYLAGYLPAGKYLD